MTKKRILTLAILSLLIVVISIYFYYDPENSDYFIKCPLKTITGYDCPGCGTQRAIHEILHLNFKKAFQLNALLFLLIPYAAIFLVFNLKNMKTKYPRLKNFLFGKYAFLFLGTVIILYTVWRNL